MFVKFLIIFISISFSISAADCEKPKMPSDEEWKIWLNNIKLEAIDNGISRDSGKNLNDVKPQSKIIMRGRCQPESTITLEEYLYYRVDKSRIIAGKNMLREHKAVLEEIGKHFDIQPRFIVSILG